MPSFEFVTVDVFTDRRFGGNPLAVFPDARGLDGAAMQAIAREFNLSETSFVLPPEDSAHSARVRIFTPAAELPFAGHPNVGTAYVLARRAHDVPETLVFEEIAGLVEVALTRDPAGAVAGARIAAPQPLRVGPEIPAALAAACGGLAADDICADRHPPVVAGVGVDFTFAELRDREALRRARPNAEGCRALAEAFAGLGHGLEVHFYVRGPDGPAADAASAGPARLAARMFAPLFGIPEDPATGSANAALAALLVHLSGAEHAEYAVEQGAEMGRPSLLHAAARRTPDGVRATVAGGCVPVMRGWLDL